MNTGRNLLTQVCSYGAAQPHFYQTSGAAGMRLIWTMLFIAFATSSALAQSAPEIAPNVERCLRDNASAVEQTVPALNDAVTFLVADVCSQQITADLERRIKEKMAETAAVEKQRCEATQNKGGIVGAPMDPCIRQNADSAMADFGALLFNPFWGLIAPQERGLILKPPVETSFASKLLMDLRLARIRAPH
jgi:hypothetical protein